MAVLAHPGRSAAARKKAIVAIARQLALDLWRLFTGQARAERVEGTLRPLGDRRPARLVRQRPPIPWGGANASAPPDPLRDSGIAAARCHQGAIRRIT